MTEEILQSAILRLKSKATEQFAIIKDLYHRPAESDTVDRIASHALLLAQYEGGMITLQQYKPMLEAQTAAEEESNRPPEPPAEEVDEEVDEEVEEPQEEKSDNEKLLERSSTYRKGQARKKRATKAKKSES